MMVNNLLGETVEEVQAENEEEDEAKIFNVTTANVMDMSKQTAGENRIKQIMQRKNKTAGCSWQKWKRNQTIRIFGS